MRQEQTIFEAMRQMDIQIEQLEKARIQTIKEKRFVRLLHAVGHDAAANYIALGYPYFDRHEAQVILTAIDENPTVVALNKEVEEYAKRYPEGKAETIWLREAIQARHLEHEPWVIQLKNVRC